MSGANPPNPHGARKEGEDEKMDQAFQRFQRTNSAKQREDLQSPSTPKPYNPFYPRGEHHDIKKFNGKPEVGLPDKIVIDKAKGPVDLPHTEDQRRARDALANAQRAEQAKMLQELEDKENAARAAAQKKKQDDEDKKSVMHNAL
jgi:hypothetical protein